MVGALFGELGAGTRARQGLVMMEIARERISSQRERSWTSTATNAAPQKNETRAQALILPLCASTVDCRRCHARRPAATAWKRNATGLTQVSAKAPNVLGSLPWHNRTRIQNGCYRSS